MALLTTDRAARRRYRRASTGVAAIAAVALFAVFGSTSTAGAAVAGPSQNAAATPNSMCC
jgi:hypothetical protein